MRATPGEILPFAATETTLPNGLRVIVVPTGFPNLVSLQIPVQTGSRNEVEPGKSGFAHFFEHMMFRGTPRFSPAAYEAIVMGAGARQNAYTTDDYTNYHITFPAEDLETILDLEADRFQHLAYAEPEFRTEARAVLGEYNKSSANPLTKLFEVQRDHAFTAHPYKHTTMGFLRDVEAMPAQYEYSRTFFQRWYRPEFTTIILAGDLEPQAALALVERYWGGWRGSGAGPDGLVIPREPAADGPVTVHVPWPTPTLPWVTLAFHGPAFSETAPDFAALDVLFDLRFGETSDLYRRLVTDEQRVDQLFTHGPATADPQLFTILARVKRPEDAAIVRDAILAEVAAALREPLDPQRLADAKSHARYGFARTLDNSESVASTLARFVRFRRRYDTLNALFRRYDALTPDDLHAAAQRYLTAAGLVQTTLSHEPLAVASLDASGGSAALGSDPLSIAQSATESESSAAARAGGEGAEAPAWLVQRSPSALLRLKLLFDVGSAADPPGKEGLAALAATLIAEGGSRDLRIDEIDRALFPLAGSFDAQVDKELTVFTGVVHRDTLDRYAAIALPQLLAPGLRERDFARLKEKQRNALLQDLRANNDEELGRERLQSNVFAGTPYGHPTLGSAAGIDALTLEDVRAFIASAYTRAALTVGLAGDMPEPFIARLGVELAALPVGLIPWPPRQSAGEGELPRGIRAGSDSDARSRETTPEKLPLASAPGVMLRGWGSSVAQPSETFNDATGITVEIIEKETRATAISFGHALAVTRAHPDFAALWLARAWLGEHRASLGRLFQRLREVRGLNYGDYAYIEAFPYAMYQLFPGGNVARRAQLFEIWIRPVAPEHAVFAFKLALYELRRLIEDGLAAEDFAATRDYLLKNVFIMTKTQDQQLAYALDNRWYGVGEFTAWLRAGLQALTQEMVNAAIRRHLSAERLHAVFVTKDAAGLRDQLLADTPATIVYESPKPPDVLEEDRIAGALPLALRPEDIRITPVDAVFAE